MRRIKVIDLEVCSYQKAFQLQEELFNTIISQKKVSDVYTGENYLILVEHPPVYTIGKNGDLSHILLSKSQLEEESIGLIQVNRGGDVTFHGLGQLVVYPILDLQQFTKSIKTYIYLLEEVVIQLLKQYNITAERSVGETGVWIEPKIIGSARKICAIGVRTSRWVTMHGLALNINTDLNYFQKIIPCGIYNKNTTSVQKELNQEILMKEIKRKFVESFKDTFNAEILI